MNQISLKTSQAKSHPTGQDVKLFAKVSSIANGNAILNIANKELGFDKLTISRIVNNYDYADFFFHASLEKKLFEVTIKFDHQLAGATSKTLLTAEDIKFSFSVRDIIEGFKNRNKHLDQILLFHEAE